MMPMRGIEALENLELLALAESRLKEKAKAIRVNLEDLYSLSYLLL